MQLLFIVVQYLIPQHLLSRLVARLADSRVPWIKNTFIDWFRKQYNVDMSEALEPDPHAYPSFNDFFTRGLRPGAREIDPTPGAIVSPVDGAFSQFGLVEQGSIVQAKGHTYTALELLGADKAVAERFDGGHFATIYLAPRDYHRIHMPLDGRLLSTTYVPGQLFSVNEATVKNVPNLFARNERLVCLFETEAGPMAVVLVGAMIVAGIETVWGGQVAPPPRRITTRRYDQPEGPIVLRKGDELGRFKLGSTVILLFGRDAIRWHESLLPTAAIRLGTAIGTVRGGSASSAVGSADPVL